MIPLDILTKIFLYLDDRKDMLSFLLTCKHFNRITERHDLWSKLYDRFVNYPHKNLTTSQLRGIVKDFIHDVEVTVVTMFVLSDLQKLNKRFTEKIVGLFRMYQKLVVVYRCDCTLYYTSDMFSYSVNLDKSLSEYCICERILRTTRSGVLRRTRDPNTISVKRKDILSESEYILCDFSDNIYSIFLDFVEWLQQYFEFKNVGIVYDNDTIVRLNFAHSKPDACIEGTNICIDDVTLLQIHISHNMDKENVNQPHVITFNNGPVRIPVDLTRFERLLSN